MSVKRWTIAGWLAVVVLIGGLPAAGAEEEAVFDLEEVSVFSQDNGADLRALVRGQSTLCQTEPDERVKAYPKFKSNRPLYGSVKFGQSYLQPGGGVEFHFAIDESGSAPAPSKPASKPRSLLETIGSALLGQGEKDDQDRTATPTEATHDRFYFDLNRDLDLTNDPVMEPLKEPPPGAERPDMAQFVFFDSLAVDLDPDPNLGTRPLRVIPRLNTVGGSHTLLAFLPAVAYRGKITIGGQDYTALLAQSMAITGRFDRPTTGLYLTPVGSDQKPTMTWWNQFLGTVRKIDDTLYFFTATPAGDKLTVRPYRGDFGTFEIGPGNRQIDAEKLGAFGLLMSSTGFLFPLGDITDVASFYSNRPREHTLPVGDYRPLMLAVDYGDLGIRFSPNPRSGDGPEERPAAAPVCGIKIRKDAPYALDFSGKPVVSFTSPSAEKTFKPGDQVRIEAILTDPALDIMLAGLEDRTRKEQDLQITGEDGKQVAIPRYASLDPVVTITDSAGKEVAGGKMPFG